MRDRDRRRQQNREHGWLCHTRKKEHALLSASKVPRRRLTPGTVVWAHVPFEDGAGEKLRPAVVVGREGRGVRIRRLSSSPTRLRYDFYLDLVDLEPAGLDRPCGIDLRSSTVVDLIEVVDIAGELSDADFLRLQVAACLHELLAAAPGWAIDRRASIDVGDGGSLSAAASGISTVATVTPAAGDRDRVGSMPCR